MNPGASGRFFCLSLYKENPMKTLTSPRFHLGQPGDTTGNQRGPS